MDRPLAEQIMASIARIDAEIARLHGLSEQLTEAAEKQAVKRGMVEIVGALHERIARGIIRQYPDLDPDRRP